MTTKKWRPGQGRDVSTVSVHFVVRNALNTLKICKKCAEAEKRVETLKVRAFFEISVYVQRPSLDISYITFCNFIISNSCKF